MKDNVIRWRYSASLNGWLHDGGIVFNNERKIKSIVRERADKIRAERVGVVMLCDGVDYTAHAKGLLARYDADMLEYKP